jgi:hypothetical protein
MKDAFSENQLNQARKEALAVLPKFKNKKILVIGDLGVDEYVDGLVHRISPEAPVPVIDVQKTWTLLGLAGNVANNVASLGGVPVVLSVIGDDETGRRLQDIFKERNMSTEHLIKDPSRPTTRKVRVTSGQHHMVRVDYEKRIKISEGVKKSVLSHYTELVSSAEAVIIEDYAKGLLTQDLCQEMIAIAHKKNKKVFIDPHSTTPLEFYQNCDVITPNRSEAFALAHRVDDPAGNQPVSVEDLGVQLRKNLKCKDLVITRGPEGMSLFSDEGHIKLPTFAKEVFDVTGAGDSVIAAMALGVSSGLSMSSACVLANYAAGIVVSKIGSVPVEIDELVEKLSN